ncbi:MAG: site-2 protease family protein [Candidatus Bathyarchaeota archaeon]|nr:site-2 protease family protein [Candidatus Bathyarchaeota archaeon]
MKTSFKIGSIWKIPIELHITFILLILAILVLSYPNFYNFSLVLFLFVFVFFHELAHSVVARHYKIKVRKIILYPIGGVSEIEEIPENPKIEWRMAIAGPATSLAIGAVLLAINQLIYAPSASTIISNVLSITGNLLFDLAFLNLILGAFNLIPAFPMDGGRAFRALLAEKMKFSDATKYAVYLGKGFAVVMAAFGVLFNFWFIIIGIFIYIGANEEAEQTIISTALARVRVKDVMQLQFGFVSPEQDLSETVEIMFKSRYHDALVIKNGEYQGIVQWGEITKVIPEKRSQIKVGDMPLKKIGVFEDEAILEAYKIMSREKIDLLPVIDHANPAMIVGVLTNEAVASAYEKAKNMR